jgi:hypothetical protein
MLTAQGVDAPKAVSYLLNAHYRLTNGSVEQRQAAYADLGKSLGLSMQAQSAENQSEIDPNIKALRDELNGVKSVITQREEMALTEARTKIASEVQAFASDPAHPYFDEVADDISAMIRAGADLQTAYEKAVWANPITRAKELSRTQAETHAKLIAKGKEEAEKARRAASTNVRTRDTTKAPTEPKGKLFSAEYDAEMREIVRKGVQRTH